MRRRSKVDASLPLGFGPNAKNPSIEFRAVARMPIRIAQIGTTTLSQQSIFYWTKTTPDRLCDLTLSGSFFQVPRHIGGQATPRVEPRVCTRLGKALFRETVDCIENGSENRTAESADERKPRFLPARTKRPAQARDSDARSVSRTFAAPAG